MHMYETYLLLLNMQLFTFCFGIFITVTFFNSNDQVVEAFDKAFIVLNSANNVLVH